MDALRMDAFPGIMDSDHCGGSGMKRSGFTLIELLTVIAILGVLASIVGLKTVQSRDKAIRASMQVDLKTLVSAQEGFFSTNKDYAGRVAGAEVAGVKGKGSAAMRPSGTNVLKVTYKGTDGWNATMTNPVLTAAPKTCGIYIGPLKYAPNAKVIAEGVPTCY